MSIDFEDMPAPIAVRQLGVGLKAIPDGEMRANYLLEKIALFSRPWLARMLGCAQRESASGEASAHWVMESFTFLLRGQNISQQFRDELIDAAEQVGELPLVAMLRDAEAVLSIDPTREKEMSRGSLASEETLGRRKMLARTASGQVLEKLLRDPEPVVIEIAMNNARMHETLVIRLAARRPINPEVLQVISKSRFAKSASVRRAMVLNPYCPPALAAQFVSSLQRQDLVTVAHEEKLDIAVRTAARRLLEQKSH